jgi:ABC-2 type transport system permease protein
MNFMPTRSTEQVQQIAQASESEGKIELAQTSEARELINMVLTAFFAIFRRDLHVIISDPADFLIPTLLQPLFYLFVFGKVLSSIGATTPSFTANLLPGIVALTIVTTAFQGITIPLAVDLGFAHEIDDRLLAPISIPLVAIEKILFAALRGLFAGTLIFPLAFLILGSGFQMRTDSLGTVVGIIILAAFAGAAFGIAVGTLINPERMTMMLALIFTPLIFTGCTFYPWNSLDAIKWFQIFTLVNPLTYASEGLRGAMVPSIQGHQLPTLDLGWVILGLSTTFIVFLLIGLRTFSRRVVS